MNRIKKFWITFLSFLPFGAAAVSPYIIAAIVGVVGVAGYSIYRSANPVNMADALKFFSSCWTCQMFSDVMSTMSRILPRIYDSVGIVVLQFAVVLTALWFAWHIFSTFMNKIDITPQSIASKYGKHMGKLALVCIVLLLPVPRLITDVAIEPIFNVGLSLNRAVIHDDSFDSCVIATAIADPVSDSSAAASSGAFSPKLRHNLACELSSIHQMTGIGMTVGWTMINMAFDGDYMHKIAWALPIFPNVILIGAGVLVLALFCMALMPVPLYFLEIFIKLSLDLVMLPLMFLAWLFDGWAISLKGAGKSIRSIIDEVINGTLGLAVTGIFVGFSLMFLEAIFGDWANASVLSVAIEKNDSKMLMDALMMRNDSLMTVILMGIFMSMFMNMIPALSKSLFNVTISREYYDKAKKDLGLLWKGLKNTYSQLKK